VQVSLHHALPHLRRGSLKLLLPDMRDPGPRETVVHYPHRQYLAPRVRVVLDALLDHLEAQPDRRHTLFHNPFGWTGASCGPTTCAIHSSMACTRGATWRRFG